jgi:hypothetical protein
VAAGGGGEGGSSVLCGVMWLSRSGCVLPRLLELVLTLKYLARQKNTCYHLCNKYCCKINVQIDLTKKAFAI